MNAIRHLWGQISRKPLIIDGAVALVLAALALVNLQLNWATAQPDLSPVWGIVFVVVGTLPLALRRRFPLTVLLVLTLVFVGKTIADVPEGFEVSQELAILTAAAFGLRWRFPVCAASFVVIEACAAFSVFSVELADTSASLLVLRVYAVIWNCVLLGAAWWFGNVLRSRRDRTRELEERTVQLAHEREENAQRAVLGERLRIARELHDVVAHHVSVMGIQAGAARRTLRRQPEKAEEALSAIEYSSREVVEELHRLLEFLRQKKDADELRPQPSLKQLGELASQMRKAGLAVKVRVDGQERPLPPAVELSAYRIVEEALTNTLKHAGPATATVRVGYGPDSIQLEILDDGTGAGSSDPEQNRGKGLIGMRERATLLGGELTAGSVSGVGFSVRATLPVEGRFP